MLCRPALGVLSLSSLVATSSRLLILSASCASASASSSNAALTTRIVPAFPLAALLDDAAPTTLLHTSSARDYSISAPSRSRLHASTSASAVIDSVSSLFCPRPFTLARAAVSSSFVAPPLQSMSTHVEVGVEAPAAVQDTIFGKIIRKVRTHSPKISLSKAHV